MKCDEHMTKTIKGHSVRRRCRRNAMEGSSKCYGHGGAEEYAGDPRLGPGTYSRIRRVLGRSKNDVYVMRVLRGDQKPGWEFALRLAAAAGVTLDELARHLVDKETEKELKEIEKRRKVAA